MSKRFLYRSSMRAATFTVYSPLSRSPGRVYMRQSTFCPSCSSAVLVSTYSRSPTTYATSYGKSGETTGKLTRRVLGRYIGGHLWGGGKRHHLARVIVHATLRHDIHVGQ